MNSKVLLSIFLVSAAGAAIYMNSEENSQQGSNSIAGVTQETFDGTSLNLSSTTLKVEKKSIITEKPKTIAALKSSKVVDDINELLLPDSFEDLDALALEALDLQVTRYLEDNAIVEGINRGDFSSQDQKELSDLMVYAAKVRATIFNRNADSLASDYTKMINEIQRGDYPKPKKLSQETLKRIEEEVRLEYEAKKQALKEKYEAEDKQLATDDLAFN